jgi:hypothetical protein
MKIMVSESKESSDFLKEQVFEQSFMAIFMQELSKKQAMSSVKLQKQCNISG